MAGVFATIVAKNVATDTAGLNTIAQVIAAANHRVKVKGWRIFCEGIVSNAAPVEVEIIFQTNGTGSGGTITVAKKNPSDDETIQTTAISCVANSSQPTASGNIVFCGRIHPQGNYGEMVVDDNPIPVPGGSRLGFRLTSAVAVECTITIDLEE